MSDSIKTAMIRNDLIEAHFNHNYDPYIDDVNLHAAAWKDGWEAATNHLMDRTQYESTRNCLLTGRVEHLRADIDALRAENQRLQDALKAKD